nr:glycoside hydrolase family 38 C-terminal domain-containing protein [uncultured Marinifilum sp.]
MAQKTAHIISHTHWDREWYLNSKYTNEWLIPFFDNLFKMFEKEPDYIFVLDGQMAMVEDYFEELDKHNYNVNEYKRKIRKYVNQDRLFIGPYYLQPDWQLLSDESLVRNLMYGIQAAKELGGAMKVGWMLDNFGQISQTSQIHDQFKLEGLYVWRGVEMDPTDVQSEFYWRSPDGTSIPSMYLLDSYRNVMRLAEFNDIMRDRVYDEVKKLTPFATTSHVLLMNGYDQEMIPDDIQPYISNGKMDTPEYKIIQSNPEKYIRDVMSEHPQLKTLNGALYSGRFISVFPGVMSARMYLKLQNDEQQKALEKRVEPLATLVWALGGEYEKTQIKEAWKTLLKNHPHDSICGVSIDDVHTDMENRTRVVNQLTQSLTEQKLKELCSMINTSKCAKDEVKIVFNPTLEKRTENVSFENGDYYVKDIPAMGYKVVEGSDKAAGKLEVDGLKVSNSEIEVSFNENGSFNILYKKSGKKFENQGIIEDKADTGDEYNYSYPDKDVIITSENCKAKIEIAEQSPTKVTVRTELVMNLPECDADSHKTRSTTMRDLPIVSYITVEVDSPIVKCKTALRNTVKDHLMRVLFKSGVYTEFAHAGSPFDVVKRPIHIEDYDESSIPEDVKKVIIGAREAKPNTIFLNREFVDLTDNKDGLAVFSKGLPEYQVVEKDTIALTLFRSVGWIAKEINSRIGDAGPEIFTPDAQCLREMQFEYAVYPHQGNTEEAKVCSLSNLYNSDLVCCTTNKHEGELATQATYFNAKDSLNTLKITAVKRSEDGKSVVIRGYNSAESTTEVRISSAFKVGKAAFTNLLEEETELLRMVNDGAEFKLDAKKIFSLKLDLIRENYQPNDDCELVYEYNRKKESFEGFEYASYVSEEEIQSELARAEALKDKADHPMWRRTALEAQLSAILARHRSNEERITELGYGLNEARVQRRVYDYIKQFKDPDKK